MRGKLGNVQAVTAAQLSRTEGTTTGFGTADVREIEFKSFPSEKMRSSRRDPLVSEKETPRCRVNRRRGGNKLIRDRSASRLELKKRV